VYSSALQTNLPYRVVGVITSTQATAGTWMTSPSSIQGVGGQAFAAIQSLGYGQTWQNMTASRAYGVTYTNSTAKPIMISVSSASQTNTWIGNVLNGLALPNQLTSTITYIIPSGYTYLLSGNSALTAWLELR